MRIPGENQWRRVEGLGEELAALPREQAAKRIVELAAAGEQATVLSLLGNWLDLPPPAVPLGAGSVVDERYVLREKLGEGGMGSVWRARQKMVSRDVALKMIHPALVTPAFQMRFVGEVELLGKLNHPCIVQIFDAGVHKQLDGPSFPFYTMELVDGMSLTEWSASHRGNPVLQLRLMAEVCSALQSAHERGIVHRDLKPGNVLVRQNGSPVVVDFGIARLAGMTSGEEKGLFSGTPQYAAPEQHLGHDHDFRSGESVDIYAVGAILFELLTGRRIFEFPSGTSLAEMRRTLLERPMPRLRDEIPGCPVFLDELVSRTLRRDPADRFYSIAALGRAITRVADSCGPTPSNIVPWKPSASGIIPGTSWKLVNKIGEGGAGEVWSAKHEQFGAARIVKFCDSEEKARTLKRESTLYRLLKERVGRNPHFIQLHDVSLDEPPWYLMMEDTQARDLESWCKEQDGGLTKLAEAIRIEIVAQTAEALQAANEAGILHRDIKPANLLIKSNGVCENIHVFVTDFGIGQLVAAELIRGGTHMGFTHTLTDVRSSLSGTMLYLAPEVLEGNPATARSDIYSLGVVFWQMLIGNLKGALDPADWSSRILDPLLREDLRRCLAGAPSERWASAGEFASSLRSLSARRVAAAGERAELAAREKAAYRKGVLRTALIAATLIVVLIGLVWFAWAKSMDAEKQRKMLGVSQTRNVLEELKALLELKDGQARRRLLSEVPRLDLQGTALTGEFRNVASGILALPSFESMEPPVKLAETDRFSEDGERLISAISGGEPVVVDVSAEPWRTTRLTGGQNPVSLRVNQTGLAAGVVGQDGNLHVQYGKNLQETSVVEGPVNVGCFAFSPVTLAASHAVAVAVARPDGVIDILLAGKSTRPLRLLRISTATVNNFPESCPASMLAFSLTREGILASAGPVSGNLLFWRIQDDANGQLEGALAGAAYHTDVITCLSWSPAADEIATGCHDGILRIWPFRSTGNVPQVEPLRHADFGEPLRDVAWSASGDLVAVLLESGKAKIVQSRAPEQRPIASLDAPGASHVAFAFGETLMAWGENVSYAWGNRGETFFAERRVSRNEVHVSFHHEGCLTATALDRVHFLNPATLAWTAGFKAETRFPACWQSNTLFFDSLGVWQQAFVTNIGSTRRLSSAPKSFDADFVTASPNGCRGALVSRKHLRTFVGSLEEEFNVDVPQSAQFMSISDIAATIAWTDGNSLLTVLDNPNARTRSMALSDSILGLTFGPQPGLLACRTESGMTFLNLSTWALTNYRFPAPAKTATPIALSPDGVWIAVCGMDQALTLAPMPNLAIPPQGGNQHSRDTFQEAITLRSPSVRRIISLHWNAHGSRIAAGTADGFVQTWNLSLLREKLRLWNMDGETNVPRGDGSFLAIRFN